jgi:hypothetical protein
MLLGGYDPAQVRAAIDERDERLARLEREAQQLERRVIETERRLQETLPRIAASAGSPGAIGAFTRRLEEIHGQARRQATRIRMMALEDAVQISERIGELVKLRDELGARVSELAGMAGIKLGGGEDGPPVGTEPSRTAIDGVYSGPVEVEVGPLSDFAQLSGFEDAAAGIEAASEIKVTRFSGGRATMRMNLDSPIELLRELEQRAPFEFKVRDTRKDRVTLDLDEGDESPRAA